MKEKLVFTTNNLHKLEEISSILNNIEILGPKIQLIYNKYKM